MTVIIQRTATICSYASALCIGSQCHADDVFTYGQSIERVHGYADDVFAHGYADDVFTYGQSIERAHGYADDVFTYGQSIKRAHGYADDGAHSGVCICRLP